MNEMTKRLVLERIDTLYSETRNVILNLEKIQSEYNSKIEELKAHAESFGCKEDDVIPGIFITINEIEEMKVQRLSGNHDAFRELIKLASERWEAQAGIELN